MAIKNAIKIPKEKDTRISVKVTPMCKNNFPLSKSSTRVFKTREGEEKIKLFINPRLVPNSQTARKRTTMAI